jgi:ribonuclease-3
VSQLERTEQTNANLSYERFEYLGDSYLNHFVARATFAMLPFANEGTMSNIRSIMVSNSNFKKLSFVYGFHERLRFVGNTGGLPNLNDSNVKMMADLFEAYLGGVLLGTPNGATVADNWLMNLLAPQLLDFKRKVVESHLRNPYDNLARTKLNNLIREAKETGPIRYVVQPIEDSANFDDAFEAFCYLGDRLVGKGRGSNKQSTTQSAAAAAIAALFPHAHPRSCL